MRNSFFEVNQHPLERAGRVLAGLILLSLVFWGPQTPWGWIGIVPILTGATGFCPLYTILGVSTCRKKSTA